MKKSIVISAVIIIAVFCTVAFSAAHIGEAGMVLPAGKKKSVSFPHGTHQTVLKDCSICHSIFPQEPGVIQKMIGDGKLKKKQVMNQCRGCHKDMKKAGQKTGPTSCASCHSG